MNHLVALVLTLYFTGVAGTIYQQAKRRQEKK